MDDERDRTIWCGNLASETTEEILFELFLQAGPLERVVIPKDKEGRKRPFGFITFKHAISVPYAIDLLSGISLHKRQLNLQNRSISADSSSNSVNHKRSYSCPVKMFSQGAILSTPKNAGTRDFPSRNSNHKNNRNFDTKEDLRQDSARISTDSEQDQCNHWNKMRFENNSDSSSKYNSPSNLNFSQERSKQQRNYPQTGIHTQSNFNQHRVRGRDSSSNTSSTRPYEKRSSLEQDLERQMQKRLKLFQKQEQLKSVGSLRLQQNVFPQNVGQFNSPWLFPNFRR